MAHICVDARMINNSGIGVYTRKYIESLLNEKGFEITLLGKKEDLNKYFDLSTIRSLIYADMPIYSLEEQIKLPVLIPKCDIFWSPHYNIPLFFIKAKKRLVTIPDVFHLAHLDQLSFTQKIYATIVTKAAAKVSDRVLTISKFSQAEIVRLTRVDDDKIQSIYLGIDADYFHYINDSKIYAQVQKRYSLPKDYILFVGNVKPNKNLKALIEAFAAIANDFPNLHLLIAGKKDGFINGDNLVFEKVIHDASLMSRIIFSGYVLSEDLPALYSMANVFVFPSLYEGFGFPPLEAMACLCPVVASNQASIPEVCGKAAFYINPTDINDIANGIRTVLTNHSYREKLINIGSSKAKEYSWSDSKQYFLAEIYKLLSDG